MDKKERREKFIEMWAEMAPKWGINKSMAQLHALLLVSDKPLCYHCFQDQLNISVGCVNKNIKNLLAWELIYGVDIKGKRREHFVAEKNIWVVLQRIIKHRKEEELNPLISFLDEISVAEDEHDLEEDKEFFKMVGSMKTVSQQADKLLDTVANEKNDWWLKKMNRFLH